jgi:pimeloyl-ACP methyl ester carboxylesterase
MAEGFFLPLSSGRVRVERFGDPAARAVICIHGISSNARVFNPIRDQLAASGRQVIAVDLRGRGLSEKSDLGTYGWMRHARDVFELADRLGIRTFDVIGHSMGAFVGMNAVALDDRRRISKLVLIDGLGLPSPSAAAALARPWNDYWERHYRYEVETIPSGGVRIRTKLGAVLEDTAYAATHSPRSLWPALSIPVLLLRASHSLSGSNGFIVTKHDMRDFLRSTPAAIVHEIDANHFGIVMHDDSLTAIRGFLC